jgi:hypothetical protein
MLGVDLIVGLRNGAIEGAQALALPRADDEARIAALDLVLAGLPRSRMPMLDTIEVSVGYPYAHYLVLPWLDEIIAPADRHAYALAMFAQQYGLAAEDWQCDIAQQSFGRAAIAALIRRDVVAELTAACKKSRLRLQRIRASLIDRIARQAAALPDDAAFVTCQTDACEFAFRRDGQWHAAFTLRRGANTLERSLMAASMLAKQVPARVYATDFAALAEVDTAVAQEADHASA